MISWLNLLNRDARMSSCPLTVSAPFVTAPKVEAGEKMASLVKPPVGESGKAGAHQANGRLACEPLALRFPFTIRCERSNRRFLSPWGGPPYKIFCLPWNVIDNKGPEMRKMGQMRLPWNVYENK